MNCHQFSNTAIPPCVFTYALRAVPCYHRELRSSLLFTILKYLQVEGKSAQIIKRKIRRRKVLNNGTFKPQQQHKTLSLSQVHF